MEEYQQRIGQLVGDYRLLKWLGGGGFGNVYLAEHIRDHDQAAIKVLQMRLTDATHLRFFLNEASMFRLRHPHIMPLLNFGLSQQDELFLVMDYAPKGTLRDRHPKGCCVPLPAVIDYVTQMASALQYAHEQHVVHRDVKPENMLLKSDDVVLLSDFGIATAAYSTHSINMSAGVGGTVPYMAPEQMDGKPRPASDQYALAVVTYEWLAGRCPFVGTAVEVVVQHTTKLPPPLRGLVQNLPSGVEEVLFKALAKNPKERFPSVQAFADALRQTSAAPGLYQPVPSGPVEVPPATLFANTLPPSLPPSRLAVPSVTRTASSLTSEPLLSLALENGEMFASSEGHRVMPSQLREPSAMKYNQGVKQAFASDGAVFPEAADVAAFAPAKQFSITSPVRKPGVPGVYRALLVVLILLLISGAVGSYAYSSMKPSSRDYTVISQGMINATVGVTPTANVDVAATATAKAALTATASAAAPTATVSAALNAYNAYVFQHGIMSGFDAQHTRTNPYERILNADNVLQLHQKWAASTGAIIFSSPVVANGIIYVGSDDNKLYAFDAASGQPKWVTVVKGDIRSSPAVANGLIYIGADNKLYAFDAASGQQKWVVSLGGSSVAIAAYFIHSSPAVVNGLVYIGSFDYKLYAFDATSGQQRWVTSIGDIITSSPAIANGLVYVGAMNGKLYALDAFSGVQKWAATTGGAINGSSPAVANGLIYVGSENNMLYALDAFSGVQKWVTATRAIINSSPAVANGLVYVGSQDFKLYAFDAFSGQQRWIAATNGMINASPTVANGVVYIGSLDDNLYAFDATTGQRKWTAHTGNSIYSSPVVVNGVVYVGSDDHICYAFSLG